MSLDDCLHARYGEAVYLGVWSPDCASAVWQLVGTPGTWQRSYAAPCMIMLQRRSCPLPLTLGS